MKLAFLKAIALVSAAISAHAGRVQFEDLTVPSSAAANRDSVVRIFTDSYNEYRQFAFGHDEVAPISSNFSDLYGGWGSSIVDGMSTMYIMGLMDFFNEALNFTQNIDYTATKTPDNVSVFESTIRHLGGLISAYELSEKQHLFLLQKAQQLADRLSIAWSLGNTVPFNNVNFTANVPITDEWSSIATAGSLTLEWSRLSKYTGNDTYRKLAEGSVFTIANNTMPLPGIPAQLIDPNTGRSVGNYLTWGGGSDSYFGYLIKYSQLSSTNGITFANSWLTAVDSSINTLLKTSTVGNHVYLASMDDQGLIRHVGSQLACTYAGNWLLGGKLANNDTIVNYALQLNDACWNTFAGTATGIGPEEFAYISEDGNFTGSDPPSSDQLAFYNEHGYYITAPYYVQRAAVLESNFYAWRVTGNSTYLERAQSAIASFDKYLDTSTGYSGIWDVNDRNSGKLDKTTSHWFAEVLKYLYLTFDDPNHISLDDYVFNAEGHPFLTPEADATSGQSNIASRHRPRRRMTYI